MSLSNLMEESTSALFSREARNEPLRSRPPLRPDAHGPPRALHLAARPVLPCAFGAHVPDLPQAFVWRIRAAGNAGGVRREVLLHLHVRTVHRRAAPHPGLC